MKALSVKERLVRLQAALIEIKAHAAQKDSPFADLVYEIATNAMDVENEQREIESQR